MAIGSLYLDHVTNCTWKSQEQPSFSLQIFVHLLLAKRIVRGSVVGELPYPARGRSRAHGPPGHTLPRAHQHLQHHHQHLTQHRGDDRHRLLDDRMHVLCLWGIDRIRIHPIFSLGRLFPVPVVFKKLVKCPSRSFCVPLGSVWSPFGVRLGSVWGPFGVRLGSVWGPLLSSIFCWKGISSPDFKNSLKKIVE